MPLLRSLPVRSPALLVSPAARPAILSLALAALLAACDPATSSGGHAASSGSSGYPGSTGSAGTPPGFLGGLGGAGGAGQPGGAPSAGGQAGHSPAGSAGHAAGSAGQSVAGSAGQPSAQTPLCQQYLACTAATNPPALGILIEAYGEQGSCWGEQSASLCEQACQTGLIASHKAYPEAEDCNLCAQDSDCTAAAPVCQDSRCIVACHSDDHCPDQQLPACDLATEQCVACVNDEQCHEPNPFCDSSSHSCVSCRTNADCFAFAPTCNSVTHQCQTGCQTDADCGGLHCSPAGICAACLGDEQCPGGTSCDEVSASCCAVGACEADGAECGIAYGELDILHLGCLLLPAQCGTCPGGTICSAQRTCLAPPPKNCGSCPGACGYLPDQNAYGCIAASSTCDSSASPSQPCSPGYQCESQKNESTDKYESVCARHCLADADCPASQSCHPTYDGPSLGRCRTP